MAERWDAPEAAPYSAAGGAPPLSHERARVLREMGPPPEPDLSGVGGAPSAADAEALRAAEERDDPALQARLRRLKPLSGRTFGGARFRAQDPLEAEREADAAELLREANERTLREDLRGLREAHEEAKALGGTGADQPLVLRTSSGETPGAPGAQSGGLGAVAERLQREAQALEARNAPPLAPARQPGAAPAPHALGGGYGGGYGRRAEELPAAARGEYGGFYYPEGYGENLEQARLQGKITDEQYRRASAAYEASPFGRAAQLEREGLEARARRGELEADQRRHLVREQEALQAAREEQRRVYFAEAKKHEASYQAAVQKLETSAIDPDRWWKNKSTGGKILAAIAAGLGAAGASMTGRQNTALQIIQKSINDDIEAQRVDRGTREKAVGARGTLMGIMRERFDTEEEAADASKKYAYERVADYYKMYQAESYPESVRRLAALHEAELRQSAAALQQKEELRRQQAASGAAQARLSEARKIQLIKLAEEKGMDPMLFALEGKELARYKEALKYQREGGEFGLKEREVGAREREVGAKEAKAGHAVGALRVRVGNDLWQTSSEAQAKELYGSARAYESAKADIRHIAELVNEAGVTGLWDPEKLSELKVTRTRLFNNVKDSFYGPQEPNPHLMRLFEENVPSDVDLSAYSLEGRTVNPLRVREQMGKLNTLQMKFADEVRAHLLTSDAQPVGHREGSPQVGGGFTAQPPRDE